MKKLNLDLKKLLAVKVACSIDKNRYVLNGVFVKDYQKNGEIIRDYVATNGRVMLVIREKIKEMELKNGIIIFFDKIKIEKKFLKMDELKTEFYYNEKQTNIINDTFNLNFEIDTESCYPNYFNVIPNKVVEFDKQFVIDTDYLKLQKEFFKSSNLQNQTNMHFLYSKDLTDNTPKIIADNRDNIIKLFIVMPLQTHYLQNLETTNKILKEFSNI